uniref:Uncharacterized protein n=1 Tax=Ananas comosus var. bracteatus TaxID=296719 RepID=A0A6V7QAN9_ANACO|nr:unnamed protein product [Ananas comosus var. bracteatus]
MRQQQRRGWRPRHRVGCRPLARGGSEARRGGVEKVGCGNDNGTGGRIGGRSGRSGKRRRGSPLSPRYDPFGIAISSLFEGMEWHGWAKGVALICLLGSVCQGRELTIKNDDDSQIYNHTIAMILVEYSSAVTETDLTALFTWTCSRCNDLTKGFEVIELIVDVQHCLQAVVGVDHNLDAIIVAFRGTQENSIQNWVEDLLWKQLDLNYPACLMLWCIVDFIRRTITQRYVLRL